MHAANVSLRYFFRYSQFAKPMQFRLVQFALAALVSAFIIGSTPALAKDQGGPPLIITLKAGGQTIRAEVAATDETRQKGLMFRQKMAKNAGMLFVFPDIAYHAMWMRNTPLPLAVAFMDESGRIVSIHEMQPFTETSHQAAGPARYALEMNGDWFNRNRLRAGDTIKGLNKAPRPK